MRKHTLFTLTTLALAFNLMSAPALARNNCQPEIQKKIDTLDLEGKTISNTNIVRSHDGHRNGGGPTNYDAWISFKQCSGNLVIRLGRSCQFQTAYTKGECSVKGLKNY